MSHDIENVSSQNAGIVMYRNIKDTIRTHFAETYGAGAFLEAPLHAYYGRKRTDAVCIFMAACQLAGQRPLYFTADVSILLLFFSSPNLGGLWAYHHQTLPHVRW